MKVKELKKILANFDDDLRIVIEGVQDDGYVCVNTLVEVFKDIDDDKKEDVLILKGDEEDY